MNKVRIAIIDDGINEKLFNTGPLVQNIEITPDLKIKQRKAYDPYEMSHGTTCAAIIKKYAPKVQLTSVKILSDDTKRSMNGQLIKAIQWCVEQGITLVNLSLGTIHFRDFDEIQRVVGQAYQKGLIIVAACNNRNVFTYPASLSTVIGVKCIRDGDMGRKYLYHPYSIDGIEISANGRHELINHLGETIATASCNSFAAPLITAEVAKLLKRYSKLTLEAVREKLWKATKPGKAVLNLPYLYRDFSWIEKAVVFNFGMEPNQKFPFSFKTEDIVTFSSCSIHEMPDCIDHYLIPEHHGAEVADTLVVMENSDRIQNEKKDIEKLIKYLDKYSKNIVYVDHHSIFIKKRCFLAYENTKIWSTSYDQNFFTFCENLKKLEVPIIAVLHDVSVSCFQLMYQLKTLFQKEGYSAVVISNSIWGKLLGFDSVSEHEIGAKKVLEAINYLHDPDVILIDYRYSSGNEKNLNCIDYVNDIDIKISMKEMDKYAGNEQTRNQETSNISIVKFSNHFYVDGKKCTEKAYIKALFCQLISVLKEDD
ncbi:MAG: S8 family serine peptidase [Clostridia bacterium]|nr:S8 family serine peptidase [Clostridia bacterium]